jgi:D-aspartate ligase
VIITGGPLAPPILILAPPRFVAPLGAMRSLGPLGVRVYSLAHSDPSIAGSSRWCAGHLTAGVNGRPVGLPDNAIVEQLVAAGQQLGSQGMLVAGSDEWAIFMAAHAPQLASSFTFSQVPVGLVTRLTSKAELYELAAHHAVPTPRALLPGNGDDVLDMAGRLHYPVMLKPVLSTPDGAPVYLANGPLELSERYEAMGGQGNVVLQEYIPCEDSDIWMFTGYFDRDARCRFGATARKIRQLPPRMGICSAGVCQQNPIVLDLAERFMSAIGYRGLVDIDICWDRRDRTYKLLDVNPRLGGAFRLMTDRNNLDVVRAMYLDLRGLPVPRLDLREGRKWLVEVADMIAYPHYRRRHGLTMLNWLRSLRGLEEGATFSVSDPIPFLVAMRVFLTDTLHGRWSRLKNWVRSSLRHQLSVPAGGQKALAGEDGAVSQRNP